MPAKAGQDTGPVSLAGSGSDTTLIQSNTGVRKMITWAVLSNTGSSTRTIEIYDSASAASSGADRIDRVQLGDNETKNLKITGKTVASGRYLVAKTDASASSGDVKFNATFTSFDGGS